MEEKTRQNAENKQTFDLRAKIWNWGKSRQNAENKQTLYSIENDENLKLREKFVKTLKKKTNFCSMGKVEIARKICQNAENKQTFDLTGKIEIEGKKSSKRWK